MTRTIVHILSLFLALVFLVVPTTGAIVDSGQTTVTLITGSDFLVTTDDAVKDMGYAVNGQKNISRITFSIHEKTKFKIVLLDDIPVNHSLKTSYTFQGVSGEMWMDSPSLTIKPHAKPLTVRVHLELVDNSPQQETPTTPPDTPSPGEKPVRPPVTPDTPSTPDAPGSDEPLVPILPPAGNVYNIAGVIPLFAGFFLLFLLFFWRRKVYRILKKHAKRHGEKPERKQLRATADAIIQLIRDEEKYPKWRKNSELTKRLETDIIRTLDEMQYPPTIPRDAVVADIIKSAKGRINRHRL